MRGIMEKILQVLFFVGILYWLFPDFFCRGLKSCSKMVDILSRRMIDSFNKFGPNRDTNQNESLVSVGNLKRFCQDRNLRKSKDKVLEKDKELFAIKEYLPPVSLPIRKSANRLTCYCLKATVSASESKSNYGSVALKNILNYCPANRNVTLASRMFNHLSQVYELKKYPYAQVEQVVIDDERVKRAIETMAVHQWKDAESNDEEVLQKFVRSNERRARKLLKDMRSKISDFLLRFTSWVLYKLLPCFLKAVIVHPKDVEMLQQSATTNLPMIFLPLHRSHLDYILMSFILLNNDVRCPLVASGDNLRIPFFGSLLRGLGAFFIKRRVDPIKGRKDQLYKTILNSYMNECLKAGHNIEFFLEGGRTRTGKPCMPKYGILSVIVEAVMDGTIEDALLVPVSINYEKLVDGNFIREQLGQPKEMETFVSAIKGIWKVLNSNYGMIRVDFNQPFSLRKLIQTFNSNGKVGTAFVKKLKSNPSCTSLYGTDVVSDEHKSIVESISKHVIYDCAYTQAVMSTNAVAFLLLNKFRDGVKIQDLVDAMAELKKDLIAKEKEVGFSGDNLDVINYAVEILGPSVVYKEKIKFEEIIKPIVVLPNVIELAYYSNSMLACFALDSVIAIALGSLDLSAGWVYEDELIASCVQLCDFFQYEFIFCKPCQSLRDNISESIENLSIQHDMLYIDNPNLDLPRRTKLNDLSFDDEGNDVYQPIRFYLNSSGRDHLLFLRSLLMPLIESYSVTANCLDKLVGRTLMENELLEDILDEMKNQLRSGTLLYEDCVSVDPVKNALKLYQKLDLLDVHAEKRDRIYYLKDQQDNSESVKSIYDSINIYRREQSFPLDIFDQQEKY